MSKNERVVICGGGPVGVVAALSLVRQGIPVTVLEAFDTPPKDPRAATLHPSTLEMLDTLDLAAGILERGLHAPAFQFRDRKTQDIIAVFDMQHIAPYQYCTWYYRVPFRTALNTKVSPHP